MNKATKQAKGGATARHTPPCDCGYRRCDSTTTLNGIRFVCTQGQYTYQHHINDFPIYAAAPELLVALKDIAKGEGRYSIDQLEHAGNTIEDMIAIANAAIAKAEGNQ